jgi:predicted RNA methylase
MFETFTVYTLVAACAAYSAWSLAPAALKRRINQWRGVVVVDTGCGSGCGGCSAGGAAQVAVEKPVVWHPARRNGP